ncbi:glycoside hydrolase family 3 N-terminal domain-containing protein [Streptomyces sp. MST-110588]|uniref:glycoside hydrolase family 3 protein n=1 Tax=Streptomyces sp. MST-110588 TaxID=2833628 RepID=UPI001F5D4954|nr:glycoside hydrolase family 3 N-terminal domain-containing protein [Streptomyces sp. MST-110588]UNO39177.1 glycoside hydrolase family 3 protein [Streptomyces sp. MST-110588]
MTELDRLVNACLLPGFTGGQTPPWVLDALEQDLAGVVIFPDNLMSGAGSGAGSRSGAGKIAEIARSVRSARPDALVALDEEGGDITRLDLATGSAYPGNLALGEIDDPDLTATLAGSIGAELAAAGVNLNLAPSVDVNSVPENPVIGVRSFGATPEKVSRHGAAFVRGLQSAGVAASAKHFPGHGATVTDSHHALPVVDCDEATFRARELAPFLAAIEAGARSIMAAHVMFPALDPRRPATLSRRLLHDLLRTELGYDGVLISTAVAMEAGSGPGHLARTAVATLRAGADLLLLGPGDGAARCAAVRAAVAEAIRVGDLDTAGLEAAAERVHALRTWAARPTTVEGSRAVGMEAARRAVRATGPVRLTAPATVVELRAPAGVMAGAAHWSLTEPLAALGLLARAVRVQDAGRRPVQILAEAAGRPLVLAVRDACRTPWQREWLAEALAARPDAIVVAVGMPDDVPLTAGAAIRAYGAGAVNTRAAAELLAGHGGQDR